RSVTRGSPAAGKIWVEVATITVPGSSRARAAMRLVLPPEPTTAVSPGTISRASKSLLTPLAPADGHDVIGRGLVDDIVEPVGVEQVGMAAPAHHGRLGIVVIGEVVLGHVDGQSRVLVPQVLQLEGLGVILGVAG